MSHTPPKKAGRKRGVPNKASATLREALAALKFNLPAELVKLYNDPDLSVMARLRLLELVMQYTHPKLREQELPTAPAQPPVPSPAAALPTADLLQLVAPPAAPGATQASK